MEKDIYHWKFFHIFFKKGEAIPVSQKASKDAFLEAHRRLLDGNVVGLYPEGGISMDGKIGKFYRGYELIPTDYDGVIVPYFIDGIFGSSFSKYKPKKKKGFLKRRRVTIYFGEPLSKNIKANELRSIIQDMKDRYTKKEECENEAK